MGCICGVIKYLSCIAFIILTLFSCEAIGFGVAPGTDEDQSTNLSKVRFLFLNSFDGLEFEAVCVANIGRFGGKGNGIKNKQYFTCMVKMIALSLACTGKLPVLMYLCIYTGTFVNLKCPENVSLY